MEVLNKTLFYPDGYERVFLSDVPNERTVCVGCYHFKNYKDMKHDVIRNFSFNFPVTIKWYHREKNSPLVGVWRIKNLNYG